MNKGNAHPLSQARPSPPLRVQRLQPSGCRWACLTQAAGSLSPAPCLPAVWCPVVPRLEDRFFFHPGIPRSLGICGSAHLPAAQQCLCPEATCEAFAPSPSLSNLQKIYPLEHGRVPDSKCSLKTGHSLTATRSPSCTDIQGQPLQKRGEGRRPRNSGRYEPFWAYAPATWNNSRMSFSLRNLL